MNVLEHRFKELVQEELNKRFIEAQMDLNNPVTPEFATNIHEIGVLRGYMKAMREAYEACDDIMKSLMEPEKKKNDSNAA